MQRRIIPSQGDLDIADIPHSSLWSTRQPCPGGILPACPAGPQHDRTARTGSRQWASLADLCSSGCPGSRKVETLAFIQCTCSSISTLSSNQPGKDLRVKTFNDLDSESQATSQLSTGCQTKFTHLYQKILCTENFPPKALKACMWRKTESNRKEYRLFHHWVTKVHDCLSVFWKPMERERNWALHSLVFGLVLTKILAIQVEFLSVVSRRITFYSFEWQQN